MGTTTDLIIAGTKVSIYAKITKALLMFVGYILLAGIFGWSGQIQFMVMIGIVIWVMLR